MFWKKIKEKIEDVIRDVETFDDYVSNYGKDDNYDIDVATAKHNYEVYQNDLKQRSRDLIKKWNKKIIESSNKGEKFFMTNQFVIDEKDKIRFMISESNCCVDFPLDVTLKHFQQYYESKGFKVVRIEYPTNNICCLKIIWISSDNKKEEQERKIGEKKEESVKKGYWEQGDMYDIGDVCSLCGYDSFLEPCHLSHCPSCHAEMKTT